jgi:hypothetical protein
MPDYSDTSIDTIHKIIHRFDAQIGYLIFFSDSIFYNAVYEVNNKKQLHYIKFDIA